MHLKDAFVLTDEIVKLHFGIFDRTNLIGIVDEVPGIGQCCFPSEAS